MDNAISTFTNAENGHTIVNKYIIVLTDATDDVEDKMLSIVADEETKDIKIISILLDIEYKS